MRLLHIMGLLVSFYGAIFHVALAKTFVTNPNKIQLEQAQLSLPLGSQLGFIAKNLHTNTLIASSNSTMFMLPASTQKVLTALVATLSLPETFQFSTALLLQGHVKRSQLQGNLIIRFQGDPELTRQQLKTLVSSLNTLNIQQINGDVLLDTSIFTSHDHPPGWIWNDLTQCFSASSAAISLNHNCFYMNVDGTGQRVRLSIPDNIPITATSKVKIMPNVDEATCPFDVKTFAHNHYELTGCIPSQKNVFSLNFAITDPNEFAVKLVKQYLSQLNIAIKGKVKITNTPQMGKVVAEHHSVSLPELIKKMLLRSDNQIADALFRYIAFVRFNESATFALGEKALKQILAEQGIEIETAVIADGSGLSRHNLISPRLMLQTMEFIYKNNDRLKLLEKFPKAGVQGTLEKRDAFIHPPLANNLTAKTGTLKNVQNLVGFLRNKRNEPIIFVQFINGYVATTKRPTPLSQFEQQIYQALYHAPSY